MVVGVESQRVDWEGEMVDDAGNVVSLDAMREKWSKDPEFRAAYANDKDVFAPELKRALFLMGVAGKIESVLAASGLNGGASALDRGRALGLKEAAGIMRSAAVAITAVPSSDLVEIDGFLKFNALYVDRPPDALRSLVCAMMRDE